MLALPLHSVPITRLHLSGFGPDDFICIGLIALALVVSTFLVRGGEKNEEGDTIQASSEGSAKKKE